MRDTNARVEGPVVDQLAMAFVGAWVEATGELLIGRSVFSADDDRPGDTTAGIMYAAPSLGSTVAERFFTVTIAGARERLFITNAYLVPNRYFRRMLVEAARRGVDVRVLTPGGNTDRPSVWWASRRGVKSRSAIRAEAGSEQ